MPHFSYLKYDYRSQTSDMADFLRPQIYIHDDALNGETGKMPGLQRCIVRYTEMCQGHFVVIQGCVRLQCNAAMHIGGYAYGHD